MSLRETEKRMKTLREEMDLAVDVLDCAFKVDDEKLEAREKLLASLNRDVSEDVIEDIAALDLAIEKFSHEYYDMNKPSIPDEVFDRYYRQLKDLKEKHKIVDPDSPTTKIGSSVSETKFKKRLQKKMYSMDNVFNMSELEAWFNRVKTLALKLTKQGDIKRDDFLVNIEYKLDGLSYEAIYEEGHLVSLCTRGDGEIGESILRHQSVIDIPKNIPSHERIVKNGELFLYKHQFENVNRVIESNLAKGIRDFGNETFKNPRNAVAGLMNRKNINNCSFRISAKDHNCSSHDIFNVHTGEASPIRHNACINYVEIPLHYFNGLKPFVPLFKAENYLDEIEELIKNIIHDREKIDEPIDGLVFKLILKNKEKDAFGYTAKFPRWSIAYKLPPKNEKTKLLDIQLNVGRTGMICPIAILEPIVIDGVTISKATLHNYDFIKAKDIRLGDTVTVIRAGDVIPYILDNVSADNNTKEHNKIKPYEYPTKCPSCGAKIKKDGPRYFCQNPLCPAQKSFRFVHFYSKAGLNLNGVGVTIIQKVVNHFKDKLSHPLDVLLLSEEDLTEAGIGKSVRKTFIDIRHRLQLSCNLTDFIAALSINYIGKSTAKKVCRECGSLNNVVTFFKSNEGTELIGKKAFKSMKDFFMENGDYLLDKCSEIGISPKEDFMKNENGVLQGKRYVLTGRFAIKRDILESLLISHGALISSSVSKNTNGLIQGSGSYSSKAKKAEELNIPIYTLEEFTHKHGLKNFS